MIKCVTISTYHKTLNDNDTILDFKKQNLDNFYILFDNYQNLNYSFIKKSYDNANICDYKEIEFNNFGFNKPIDRRHRWGNHQNPKYFYAHFRMLVMYLKYSDYDYYWFFDDDVTFKGNIKNFLSIYDNINDDFIAIQAFKKENYTEFPKISVLNDRMLGSHGSWLNMCPGPGDNFKNTEKHIGSFFPIVRYSNRAMSYLYKIHQEGYYGYSEGFVPTSLGSAGFSVSSMLDEHNNFFIPNDTDCILFHKWINFTWEWL
jgi:hypothetical protein